MLLDSACIVGYRGSGLDSHGPLRFFLHSLTQVQRWPESAGRNRILFRPQGMDYGVPRWGFIQICSVIWHRLEKAGRSGIGIFSACVVVVCVCLIVDSMILILFSPPPSHFHFPCRSRLPRGNSYDNTARASFSTLSHRYNVGQNLLGGIGYYLDVL